MCRLHQTLPYTGKFSWAKIFADRWFRVFCGKYFRGLNTSTENETSMHFTQSTSMRHLGTILGHFSRIIFSRIATKTRNPQKFSTAKKSRYTVCTFSIQSNSGYLLHLQQYQSMVVKKVLLQDSCIFDIITPPIGETALSVCTTGRTHVI